MLSYCKKCGRIMFSCIELQIKCDVCNSTAYEVPREYIDNFRWRDGDGKEALIAELVKPSPEFDQYLFDHREEILAKKNAEFNRAMAIIDGVKAGKNNKPKCPTCQSTNVTKISTAKKAFGFAAVGVFSSNLGKTMECKNCGYKW